MSKSDNVTESALFFLMIRPPPISTLFPYTTLFRSFAVYGALALILSRGRTPQTRVRLGAASVAISLLVGAAQIYLGAHWFTDVLAGYVLGGIWLFGVMMWFPDPANLQAKGETLL